MAASARVLATRPDGSVTVELSGARACPGCRCGRLALSAHEAPEVIELDAASPLRVGDEVVVTAPAAHVLGAAVRLHGIPLAGLLAGAAAGMALGGGDIECLVGAIAGLSAALSWLRLSHRSAGARSEASLTIAPRA